MTKLSVWKQEKKKKKESDENEYFEGEKGNKRYDTGRQGLRKFSGEEKEKGGRERQVSDEGVKQGDLKEAEARRAE